MVLRDEIGRRASSGGEGGRGIPPCADSEGKIRTRLSVGRNSPSRPSGKGPGETGGTVENPFRTEIRGRDPFRETVDHGGCRSGDGTAPGGEGEENPRIGIGASSQIGHRFA